MGNSEVERLSVSDVLELEMRLERVDNALRDHRHRLDEANERLDRTGRRVGALELGGQKRERRVDERLERSLKAVRLDLDEAAMRELKVAERLDGVTERLGDLEGQLKTLTWFVKRLDKERAEREEVPANPPAGASGLTTDEEGHVRLADGAAEGSFVAAPVAPRDRGRYTMEQIRGLDPASDPSRYSHEQVRRMERRLGELEGAIADHYNAALCEQSRAPADEELWRRVLDPDRESPDG